MSFVDEKYFKVDGNNIVFTGPYMEAYIPGYFFDKNYAQEIGDAIKSIGLFNIRTFNDVDGKNPNPLRLFNVPIQLMTYPTSYDAVQMDLHKTGEKDIFVLMKYYKGDIFCPSAVPKSLDAFEIFLAILIGGKVPSSTSYHDIIDIWKRNFDIADVDFDVSDTVYELVISEIYRNKKDPVYKFGSVLAKDPKHSPYDYKTASPRQITKLNSNFTGITFENMDEMLLSGINRTQTGTPEHPSPMEKIIKY